MSTFDFITGRIPFMRPGRTARNVAVVLAVLLALLFLPVTMLLIALAVPLLLTFNIRGLRDRLDASSLSRLPGLSHERRIVLVLAAFVYLLVLAGAASAVWSGVTPSVNNTTAGNGTPTATAPTAAPTPTTTSTATTKQSNASSGGGQTSPYPDQTLIKNVSVVNERDSDGDGDGRPEAFGLRVRANTTLPAADTEGDPGEPYFAVAVGGTWQFDTPQVQRAANGTFTIRMNESRLSSASPGSVWVRVRLMNRNTIFHDRIATRKVNVPYAPASTPTPTPTPTATETPTPTATPTPTPEQSGASDGGSSSGGDGSSGSSGDSSSGDSESSARGPNEGSEWTVTVTEIVDGDTVKVSFPNGDEENIRLLGVDTPEVSGGVSPGEFEDIPENDGGKEHLSKWADRARGFAADQLDIGEEIRIELDPSADRRGSYDRLLVYVYHDDGQLLNRQLLKDGYARFYDSEFSKHGEFEDLELDAQSGNVGLWDFNGDTSTPTPTPESESGGDDGSTGATPTPSGGASDPYDCGDFEGYPGAAQEWFENHNPEEDPAGLDGDGNMEACE